MPRRDKEDEDEEEDGDAAGDADRRTPMAMTATTARTAQARDLAAEVLSGPLARAR